MNIDFLAPPCEAAPYCWIFEIGTIKFGVHQTDGWCMKLDERILDFSSENRCVPLGPILDVDEGEFFNLLAGLKRQIPAYADSIDRFPKVMLLKHIFHTSFSGYWPEKALAWLNNDRESQPLFRKELEGLIENKAMPQGVRQRAKKILRTL